MPGFATGVAVHGKSEIIGRVNQVGPLDFFIQNKGDYDAVMSFLRAGDDGASSGVILTDRDTRYTQLISDEESLEHVPVIPRTLRLTASGKPTLYDRDGDGVLRIARTVGALLAGAGGFLGVGGGTTSAAATKQLTVAGETFTTKGVRVGDKLIITDGLDKGVYTVTVRNSQTVVTVDRAWPTGSQTHVGYAIYAEDLDCGKVNYATGLVHVDYPSGDAPGSKARVKGTCLFPIALDPGMTLIATADTGGGGTATWDAVAAVAPGAGGVFAQMANETFEVSVNGGSWQKITMGVEALIANAITTINGQLVGALASNNAGQVDLTSDRKGTSARIQTRNVAAGVTTKLGIANNDNHLGTGDVVDISAVTYAEFASRIVADMTTVTPDEEDGSPVLISGSAETGATSTIQVTGGTAPGIFGFDGAAHAGSDAGGELGVAAVYYASTPVPAGQTMSFRMVNLPQEEIIIGAAGIGGSSLLHVTYTPEPQAIP